MSRDVNGQTASGRNGGSISKTRKISCIYLSSPNEKLFHFYSQHIRTGSFLESVRAALVVPQGFEIKMIGTNLNPTAMRTAPDGRIFLCEKHGKLRVIENDVLLATPVLTLSSISTWNERGLIGLEFDPDFESNGFIYLHYTHTNGEDASARVSRFTLEGNTADMNSETVIFEGPPFSSNAGMHNGGSLVIDNSGKLFIFIGDTTNRTISQTMTSPYGKVLRVNLNGSIPEDNPHYGNELGIHPAIWASGLRNPFTVAYNAETDQTIIGDVGEATWEELNLNKMNANYGWPTSEGFTNVNGFTEPQIAYNHILGCAITGLSFYTEVDSEDDEDAEYVFPEIYHNKLFFADYCKSWIRVIDINGNLSFKTLNSSNAHSYSNILVKGTNGVTAMAQGHDGGLYFTERGTWWGAYTTNMGVLTGSVYKLIYTGSSAPKIYAPLEQWPAMPVNRNYTLAIGATGVAPLTYKWYRNSVLISGATAETLKTNVTTMAMNGTRYRVQVSNLHGSVMSNEVVLLLMNQTGLTGSIWTSQQTYKAGDDIDFSATIVDNFNDPIRLVSWTVDLMHQTHTHPFAAFSNVNSGRVSIPLGGELDPVQGYAFTLIVQNSITTSTTKKVIYPRLGQVILDTDPPGMKLRVNNAQISPVYQYNITGVVNTQRVLYAPGTQAINNETYVFINWTDGDTSNQKTMTLVSGVQQLVAMYCNVRDCPDVPLTPVTANADFTPPVAVPAGTPVKAPIIAQPDLEPESGATAPVPQRELIQSSSCSHLQATVLGTILYYFVLF